MSLFNSIIYGFVQALTEFLPVSSSGHLALLPGLLGTQDPGVAFDLAMHLGTALAIICYFFKDLLWLTRSKHIINYIIASFGTAILVFPLKDIAEQYARQPWIIAINLIVFGWILYFCDRKKVIKDTSFQEKTYLKESFLIGVSQAMAIFPGVSRSGSTISLARLLGFSKEHASRFSFLLSLPIILGGAALKYKDIAGDSSLELSSLAIGIAVSFIFGLFVIHYFLKMLSRIKFVYFAWYRTALAIIVLFISLF